MKRWPLPSNPTSQNPKFVLLEMLRTHPDFTHGPRAQLFIGERMAWFFQTLQGFNVLHPIGWDSFGQPARAGRDQRGINPRDWTEETSRTCAAN